MKKKIAIFCFMIISGMFFSVINIMAYSPHYLPGGKNYLSEDNFYYETPLYYTTIENFLVKPYTTYTLTLPIGYCESQFTVIEVVLYDNSDAEDFLEISPDMLSSSDGDWFYYTFTTTSSTNYMSMTFEDGHLYFAEGSAHEIQLEEGEIFTGFEPYIEGEILDTSAPYFQNSGSIISYFDSPITIAEIQSALTAYDSVDGDVTSSITLISDGYTANMGILGLYSCVFEVSDTSSNTSQVIVEIEVVDALKPVFSELDTLQAVFPNSYSATDILEMLSASDNYDGDISNQIIMISDNYSENSSTIGTYNLEFEVTDSSGNTQNYIQQVEVIDDEFPIISGITSVSIGYDELITEAEIVSNIEYTDNYDSLANLELILETDTYSSSSATLGNYEMTFSVTDSSGNKAMCSIIISVVDEIGPILYFNSSIIQTYSDTVLDLPAFTQLLINTNELESDVNYYVTVKYDSYTRNAGTPGVYHLKLNLTDGFGDEYNKDLEIRVVDRPVDYVHMDEPSPSNEGGFIAEFKGYILGGILSFLLIVSNVVWVVILKKK